MRPRTIVALLLLGVLVALTPLAHARPPDPTWIAGLWDDADYDDVVLLVTFSSETVDAAAPADVGRHALVVEFLPSDDESRPAAVARSSNPARAPPVR